MLQQQQRQCHGSNGGGGGRLHFVLVPAVRVVRCLVPGYGSRAYCAGSTVILVFFFLLIMHTFLLTMITQQYYSQRHRDSDIRNEVDFNQQFFQQNQNMMNEEEKQREKDNSSKASKHLLAAAEYNYDKLEQPATHHNTQQRQYSQRRQTIQAHPIQTFIVNVETIQDKRNPPHQLAIDTNNFQKSFHKSPNMLKDVQGGVKVNRLYRERQYKTAETVVEVNIGREKKDEDWEAHEDMSLEHLIVAEKNNKQSLNVPKLRVYHSGDNVADKQQKALLWQRLAQLHSTRSPWTTTRAPSPNHLKQAKLRLSLQMRKKHKMNMLQKPALLRQPAIPARQLR